MIVLATSEENHVLPMAPVWFGVIALIVFAVLLVVTLSFRNMAHRHDPRASEASPGEAGRHDGAAGGH